MEERLCDKPCPRCKGRYPDTIVFARECCSNQVFVDKIAERLMSIDVVSSVDIKVVLSIEMVVNAKEDRKEIYPAQKAIIRCLPGDVSVDFRCRT